MLTGHKQDEAGASSRLLRRASRAVAGWVDRWPRGGRDRTTAVDHQPRAAPGGAEQETSAEPALPVALAYGQDFLLPDGLALTVTAIGTEGADPRHVVIDVCVTNRSDHTAHFENDFGVLDAAGTAHRYTWVNAGQYPGVLPGIASLEPQASLDGRVHILLPELPSDELATLRPAFLQVINSGCGGCNHEVVFLPQVLWQPARTEAPI
ncbi:MAG: hypothetical protein AB7R89_34585 [Dehalococcoidia bacterium]